MYNVNCVQGIVEHEEPPPDQMNDLSKVNSREDSNNNISLNILPTNPPVQVKFPICEGG